MCWAAGDLGCFSLTEKFAGVNSGLVVHTTATFDPATSSFTLNTPNEVRKRKRSRSVLLWRCGVTAVLCYAVLCCASLLEMCTGCDL